MITAVVYGPQMDNVAGIIAASCAELDMSVKGEVSVFFPECLVDTTKVAVLLYVREGILLGGTSMGVADALSTLSRHVTLGFERLLGKGNVHVHIIQTA